MTKVNIIQTVRQENIGSDDKLKAAVATRDLRLKELEIAKKAVEEANEYINFLIEKKFNEMINEMSLKIALGELIHFPEYDLSYFWSNGHLHQLPTKILGDSVNG